MENEGYLERVSYFRDLRSSRRRTCPSYFPKPHPSDVSDEESLLFVPYLTLMKEDAPQRSYSSLEMFNAPSYMIRYGSAWGAMPNGLPP